MTPADQLIIETPADDRFARAALSAVNAPLGRYAFSDWNPTRTATKAGLGGSAAATVCACLAGSPGLNADALQAIAHRVHSEVQGSGSGIDIAAAAHGGVLRFEAGQIRALEPLEPVVIFSGTSADTGSRVREYLASNRGDFVAESARIVDGFESDPIAAMGEATALLDAMTSRAGIAWWTPALRAISALASEHRGAAKPSGAGGGDVAVALFRDRSSSRAFQQACADSGFAVIPTDIAPGARRL